MTTSKRRIFALFAVAALLFCATPAKAALTLPAPNFSGAELMKMCTSTYDTDYGFCAGYVSAVTNLMMKESIAQYRACNLQNVRSQQQIDLFRGYMEIFPEAMNGEASAAVAAALARAFPCRS